MFATMRAGNLRKSLSARGKKKQESKLTILLYLQDGNHVLLTAGLAGSPRYTEICMVRKMTTPYFTATGNGAFV